MRKFLLLLCALLGTVGAMATDVTVIKSTSDATTYGSLSGTTFTTNAASGLAGVTIEGIKGTTATSFAYGASLALTSTSSGTITMTAPDGYIITGYALTARSNTYAVPYTLTPSAGGSAVTTSTGGVNLEASGLTAQTASFTYSAASANSFYIPSMTITVMSATANLVNVTYELYESDGTTLVNTVVKEQEENSAIEIPTSLTAPTYYDYSTEGTIGNSDCTIKVIRTLKAGYVISLGGFSNSKCYNIRNNRATWAVGSGANVVNSTSELGLAFSSSDVKQQFAFITYEGNVYLYSVGEGKFAYIDGTKLSLTADVTSAVAASPVTFEASTNATYKYSEPIIVTIAGSHFGVSTGFSPDIYKYQNSGDGGNCAYIIEAGSFDATAALAALDEYFHPSYMVTYVVKDVKENTIYTSDPVGTTLGAHITTLPSDYQFTNFYEYNTVDVTISSQNTIVEFTATLKENPNFKFTADATSPIWYKLKMKDANYPTYVSAGTPNVTLPTTDANDETVQWAFIGNPYAGFQIVNRAAGTSLVLGSASAAGDGANGGNTYVTLATSGTQTYERFFAFSSSYLTNGFFLFNAESQAMNQRSTANLAYWTGGYDKGSTFVAEEILEGEALYNELLAEVQAINYGSGLGQYTLTGDLAGYAGNEAGRIAEIESTYGGIDYVAGAEALQAMIDNKALNMPTAGFYRIKGKTSGKYLAAGFASNNKFAMTDATDGSTVFYFDGTQLINIYSGLSNGMLSNAWAWVIGENASTVTFQDGLTNGGYAIKSALANNDNNANFYDNGDNTASADRGGNVTISASTNTRYTSWTLEEVTTLPVTISAAGYATLCAPVALNYPSTVVVNTVTIATDNATLNLTEVTGGAIPANTPVLLSGKADTYNFEITTGVSAIDAANVLVGTTAAIAAPNESYILQNQSGKVGFYQVDVTEATPNVPGFRAYLNVPSSSVKAFFFDKADGISSVNVEQAQKDATIFNIAGQRVAKAQKGIYIMNGKKVLVK